MKSCRAVGITCDRLDIQGNANIHQKTVKKVTYNVQDSSPPRPIYFFPTSMSEEVTRYFVGRDNTVRDIHTFFQEEPRDYPKLCALVGLGGIGTTETAYKYIREKKSSFTHVVWIDAQSQESLDHSRRELTDEMLHKGYNLNYLNRGDIGSLLRIILETSDSSESGLDGKIGHLLIIFDGASCLNSDNEKEFFPEEFFSTGIYSQLVKTTSTVYPSVLVTSRFQNWEHERITTKTIPLDQLNPEESETFFNQKFSGLSNPNHGDLDLSGLCSTLDGLPIALQQSSEIICKRRCLGLQKKIQGFLDNLERAPQSVLETKIGCRDKSTWTLWESTLQRIDRGIYGTWALSLFLSMCMSGEDVPGSWDLDDLLDRINRDEDFNAELKDEDVLDHVVGAIELLRAYSMVSADSNERNSIHSIVKTVMLHRAEFAYFGRNLPWLSNYV